MCLRVTNLLSLACSLGLVLAGDSARAGTRTWDFTTDPTLDTSTNALTIGGNNATIWQATTGNPGGFLALTYAETSQSAAVIFPDIDQGKIVTGFEFDCDLRIGNPSTAGPADGFSINFARISDPMIINTPPDVTNAGVSGQPEDGTGTGIAIGFDTWSGNTLADGTADLVGIIVSVDKTVVLKQPMPTISGAADDATSMQTGPRDGAYWDGGGAAEDPAAWAGLQWRHLSVVLDTTAKLSVTYKGKVLLDKFQTAYFPSAGRIVLMGRTGSSDENTHFDNITLTTTATSDNQPPSAIANLKVAEVGAGHVTLTWDPSTDLPDATARVAYNIQRGGTNLVLSLTTNRFVDFGVKPNTKYDYQVQAVDLAGNTSAFSPISATTVAEVPSVGVVKGEIYDNISGTTVDLLLADPTYPNTPSRVTYINSLFFGTASGNAGFANSFGDNYGARITGTITPTASGQYNFFIRSDDSSQFYLNTSSATLPVPGTDTPLIEETSCCHAFLEPTDTTEPSVTTQTPVSLTAGKSYGFVILLKEGGGGDGVGVAWRLASDTSPAATLPAISGAVLTGTQDAVGASVTFTTSPKDTTVIENEKVVFTAAATAVSAFGTSVGYQWYKNGTAIPGAFGATYTIPVVALSDSGSKFKVMAIGIGAQTTSPEVTLTVTADKKAPTITSVNGDETGTILTVGFSEPVTSPSATTAANYALNNGGTVSAATLSADRFSVQLTTPKLTETTVYTLTVNNVKDNAGNSVAADSKFLFQSWGLVAGRAKMEQWNNIANTDVASLLSDASYAGPPSVTRYLPGLQAGNPNGNGGWNDSFGDNYGARIKAYISSRPKPPSTTSSSAATTPRGSMSARTTPSLTRRPRR